MKKIVFLLFLLASFCTKNFAQNTTPRPPYSNASATRVTPTRLVQNLTDGSGKDSVWISPNAYENYYSINAGDTIKGSLYIGLDNVTRSGITYSKANIYKYDEVVFDYRSGGKIKDTLFFDSEFLVDSAGNGANSRIIIPVDATKKSYLLKFIWDGTKFVQSTLCK